ncbi:hypothetical protein O181_089921 [Austropuccinia psidii MF-1]|uniref:Uncharacterized protein n=1 Tax=Austropuccinia psidii MF-1 TaxID=1389203 RepID=A0A9Q3P8A4_9BASI|nr:hypothetical protein [Austropuccinia psidii MF-1]
MKILKKYGGELEYSLRSRFIEPCLTEDYINALEDIVTRTKIGRTWKNFNIKIPRKLLINQAKPVEPLKNNTSRTNGKRKFHKCGGIRHLDNNCLKKAKINEILEEDHNCKEESDFEKYTEESETS